MAKGGTVLIRHKVHKLPAVSMAGSLCSGIRPPRYGPTPDLMQIGQRGNRQGFDPGGNFRFTPPGHPFAEPYRCGKKVRVDPLIERTFGYAYDRQHFLQGQEPPLDEGDVDRVIIVVSAHYTEPSRMSCGCESPGRPALEPTQFEY